MEQEECRLRLARLYKLTPDEADDLIREATDHLRRERLKQVRNQSRQISKKTLRNVKDAERKAFQEMSNTLQNEWETNRQQRLNDAIAEYEAATKEKGAAQAAAREAEQVLMSINNQKLIQRRLEEANKRHQVAIKRLRQEKLENAAIKTKAKLDREKALEKEKIRAATVAALPKPEKPPNENLPDFNLPEVQLRVHLRDELTNNKNSFYHHPQGIVEPASEFDNFQTGFEAAEEESDRHRTSTISKTIRVNEQSGKSAVRGAVALHQVRLENSKNTLEGNLEILRRKEAQRTGHQTQEGNIFGNAAAFASDKPFNRRVENQRQYKMETMIEQAFNAERNKLLDAELDISTEDTDDTMDITVEPTYDPDQSDYFSRPERSSYEPPKIDQPEAIITQTEMKSQSQTGILKNEHEGTKEHTVRFTDEAQALIKGFEKQKAEMENILKAAREEHNRQLAELKSATAKATNERTLISTNQSISSVDETSETKQVEAVLSNAQKELENIKSYQQRLLAKYKDGSTLDRSERRTEDFNQSDHIVVREVSTSQSEISTPHTTQADSKPLTFPRYSPPILDSMNTTKGASFYLDQSETNQSGQSELRTKNDTLACMESALRAEREKLQKNQAELIKLQRLAENADNTGSTFHYTEDESIIIRELSTDQPESGHAVSTPRSDSHVSVTRSQSGSIRKVSRRSTPSGSEKSNNTSYQSLPKSSPLNDSFNSTISTISHVSQASRDSATKSLEKRNKTNSDVTIETNTSAVLLGMSKRRPSDVSVSQASVKSDTPSVKLAKKITDGSIIGGALSFAGNNDSTQKLIQETWAEILARESGLPSNKLNLTRPDLSVTEISTPNTTNQKTSYDIITDQSEVRSRTPSILRSASSLSSNKSVTFSEENYVKEISPDKTTNQSEIKSNPTSDWSLSDDETQKLTEILLQKLTKTEAKLNRLDNNVKNGNVPSADQSESRNSNSAFEVLSASINQKLDLLDKFSDDVSEDTPKESTKLSNNDSTTDFNQFSSISHSSSSSDTLRAYTNRDYFDPIRPQNQNPATLIGGLEFGVQQSPVKLTEEDLKELPDLTSSFETTNQNSTENNESGASSSFKVSNGQVEWVIDHGNRANQNPPDPTARLQLNSPELIPFTQNPTGSREEVEISHLTDLTLSSVGLTNELLAFDQIVPSLIEQRTPESSIKSMRTGSISNSTNQNASAGSSIRDSSIPFPDNTLDRINPSSPDGTKTSFDKLKESLSTSLNSFLHHEKELEISQNELTEHVENSQQNENEWQQVIPDPNKVSEQSSPEKTISDYQTPRSQGTDSMGQSVEDFPPPPTEMFPPMGSQPAHQYGSAAELLKEVEELHRSFEDTATTSPPRGNETIERILENSEESSSFHQMNQVNENETNRSETDSDINQFNYLAEQLINSGFERSDSEFGGSQMDQDEPQFSSLAEKYELEAETEEGPSTKPSGPGPSTGPISIQEAFLQRKQKFIQNSQKRQEKVKEAFYKPPEKFTQVTNQFPQAVKLEKPKTSQSKSRIPRFSPERAVKKTDSEKEAKERTKRIYQRSHEYKEKKALEEKRNSIKSRLERRKEYAEKIKRKSK